MRRGCVLFLSFACAVAVAMYVLPAALWLWVGLGALVVAGVALWRKWSALTLAALGIFAALLWTAGYRAVFYAPWEELSGRRTEVTLTLAETPELVGTYAARATAYLHAPGKIPTKALFYGDTDLLFCRLGDSITVTADLSMADRLYGEETAVYTSKGIFLRLTARGAMTVSTPERLPFYILPAAWGEKLSTSVQTIFPSDVAPFLAALTAGDRSALSEGLSGDLSRAGVSHLVALSGMHICFLAALVSLAVGHDPKRRALVTIPILVLFALAVGAAASVLRAVILYVLLLLAPLLGREADRWTSLSFALAFLLWLAPYSVQNIGLQLSFAAAAGLTLVADPLREKLTARLPQGEAPSTRRLRRLLRPVLNTCAATVGALTFTLPLSMLAFGSVSLIQPLTNLLILPVAPVLFALTLILALVGLLFPAPAAFCAGVVSWLARYVLGVVSLAARLPLSAVTTDEIYYPAFLLGVYALALLLWLGKGTKRRRVFLLAGGILLAAAFGFTSATFHSGDLTAAVLNVGQGQSVLLTSQGQTALIDCGGNTLTDPGDVAADYLQDRGENALDYLILTHYHSDHTNGLEALLRRVTVKTFVLPEMEHDEDTQIWLLNQADAMGARVIWITENTDLPLGQAVLRLYAPLGDGGANEEGLSLLAGVGDFELLVTGDMNTAVEELLVEYGDLPSHVEVLVAGHHGSRYATGDTLLDAVHPSAAILSVGRNSYGHPADDTLRRLDARQITVYRTDRQGTVTVTARQF